MRRHARGRRASRSSRARARIQGRELSQSSLALVEEAIRRTRRDALTIPATLLVLFAGVVIWNPTHPATIIIGIVAVIAILAAARRRWVLRRSGPFVTAVLDRTGEVASIEQWPQKLGPKQRPSMIWIKTTANQQCMLALDTKQGENNAALVRALHERSPSATIVYPTLSTATAVR